MNSLETGSEVNRSAPQNGLVTHPTIVLVEPDPYLAFLIRLHVPEATVVEAPVGASADDIRALNADLVVAGVETQPSPISDLLSGDDRPRVLAVVDGARASRTTIPSAVDGILARPFVPAELTRAVRSALGLVREAGDTGAPPTTLERARMMLGPARFAAIALSAVLEVAGSNVSTRRAIILAIAFAYVTVRWVLRKPSIVSDAADVAVAVALVAATGGLFSNYIPFAVVACAGVGLTRGPSWGAASGFVVVLGSITLVVHDLSTGRAGPRETTAWFLLFPLIGITGGFGSRVWRIPQQEGLDVLVEANRVLSSLYRIARSLPGGLEIGTVADAAVLEIRDALRAGAGAMLLQEAGTYAVVSSFGLRDPNTVMVRDITSGLGAAVRGVAPIIKADQLHPDSRRALGDFECWITAPLNRDGVPQGCLLAACPDERRHDANLLLLQRLADEASVAVENARLFSRVREISIDEERQRLARELHDGVAQALTHLRFELEFMTRHGKATQDQVKKEIERLSRVVARASNDVRSMITGLRSSVSAEGLAGSLRSYLSDLRGLGGPEIVFEARGEARLRPDIESEMFRIAQEAVSNAMRHAGAEQVKVSLLGAATQVSLTVEDDGTGISRRRQAKGVGGVGLGAMRERAELIGARLEIADRIGGGTRVRLDYTVEEST
ncbi:MAG: histidine kinase [Actinomycetota bacterium]